MRTLARAVVVGVITLAWGAVPAPTPGQASVVVAVPFARNRSATATCIAIPAGSADSSTRIRGE